MNLKKVNLLKIGISGDINFRGECPSETAEQVSFLQLLRLEFPNLACIAVHVRNEGKRTAFQGYNQKIEGMVKGAPDIIIPCSPPILIELKRLDHTKSKVSDSQLTYLSKAKEVGADCCIALGAKGAIEFVRQCKKQ